MSKGITSNERARLRNIIQQDSLSEFTQTETSERKSALDVADAKSTNPSVLSKQVGVRSLRTEKFFDGQMNPLTANPLTLRR